MRSTIVPAQITTIEDRIAGNVTFTQILLLITPVFASSLVYVVPPNPLSFTLTKTIAVTIIGVCSITLAIRFQQRLILEWLIVMSRYFFRPRVYLYNKNTTANRHIDIAPRVQLHTQKLSTTRATHVNPEHDQITQDYVSMSRGTQVAFRFTHKGLMAVKNI